MKSLFTHIFLLFFCIFNSNLSIAQTFNDIIGKWKLASHTIEIRNNTTNEIVESTEMDFQEMYVEFRNKDEMYVHDNKSNNYFAGTIIINGNESQCLLYKGKVMHISYHDSVNNAYNEIYMIIQLVDDKLYTMHCQPGIAGQNETLIEIAVYQKVN